MPEFGGFGDKVAVTVYLLNTMDDAPQGPASRLRHLGLALTMAAGASVLGCQDAPRSSWEDHAANTRKDLSYLGLATVTATDVATVTRANVMEPDAAASAGHLATLARTSQRDRELLEFVGGVEETAAYLGGVEPWIPDLVDPNTCIADVQYRLLDPEHQPVPEEIVLLDVGTSDSRPTAAATADLVLVPDLPPLAGISYVHEPTLVGLGQPRPDGTRRDPSTRGPRGDSHEPNGWRSSCPGR